MRIKAFYGNDNILNYSGLTDRFGQISQKLRRSLTQQTNGGARGNFPIDVLPPELLVSLQNLRPQNVNIPTTPPAAINNPATSGDFNNQPLLVGVADQQVLQNSPSRRIYLFIINTHASQIMYLRFGGVSDNRIGIPIAPNGGYIEYNTVIPQDDIHLIANGANTTGVLVFSNKAID